MGYETRLIIGRKTDIDFYDTETKKLNPDYKWFQEYASVDLCKIGGLEIQYDKFPKMGNLID